MTRTTSSKISDRRATHGPIVFGPIVFGPIVLGPTTLDEVQERTGVATDEDLELRNAVSPDTPWITIVWNDPVNLMSYVSYVFRSYFGFSEAEAEKRMLQVHNDGRAVVATGNRELMERHVEAMHEYGLWATITKADS